MQFQWNKVTRYSILLLVFVFIAVFYLGKIYNKQTLSLPQSNHPVSQPRVNTRNIQIPQIPNDAGGLLKITSPKPGDVLCYGNTYNVAWQAPTGMKSVGVELYTTNTGNMIGSYPAVNNTRNGIGYGNFSWDLTNNVGYKIPIGQAYTLQIGGMYQGHQISTSTAGVFSVSGCGAVVAGSSAEALFVPPLYSGFQWTSASTTYDDAVEDELSSSYGGVSLQGTTYKSITTSSSSIAYIKSVQGLSNTTILYYGGDNSFLSYYDQALRKVGYMGALGFDSSWNLGDNNESVTDVYSFAHYIITPAADGPSGSTVGYINYYQGNIRVIVLTSLLNENDLFVSNIINLKDLFSSSTVSQ